MQQPRTVMVGTRAATKRPGTSGHESEAMAVRSVRLPDDLWRRLGESLALANVGRRRPITLSMLIRGLLERGLLHPDGLEEIGSKIVRLCRVSQQLTVEREAVTANVEQQAEKVHRTLLAATLFDQMRPLVMAHSVSAKKFLQKALSFSDDPSVLEDKQVRNELHEFYLGLVSDESAISGATLILIQKWLDQQRGLHS